MKYRNTVVTVSNYATDYLAETLNRYGNDGYKIVNVVLAKNSYGVDVMYLFFTKKVGDNNDL